MKKEVAHSGTQTGSPAALAYRISSTLLKKWPAIARFTHRQWRWQSKWNWSRKWWK